MARIDALAAITESGKPWTRVAFSDLHLRGREWLKAEFERVGLEVIIDAAGNLVGRQRGTVPGLGALSMGSHSDTVPSGGRFDGVAGVVAALEAVETLRDAGKRLRHPLVIFDFLAEEPNKYGLSCIGSRALSGALSADDLVRQASDGSSMAEGIAASGGSPEKLGGPLMTEGELAAFVELHIEQGRVLEQSDIATGVVSGIAGIRRVEVALQGRADHSGATPMSLRRDALVAAAEFLVDVERHAVAIGSVPFVATVGKFEVLPNAANVVPGCVELTLEVRSTDDVTISDYLAGMQARLETLAGQRGLSFTWEVVGANAPVLMSEKVQSAIASAAEMGGASFTIMPSGAGHDAAFMARLCPSGMIFVPSKDGRSHCPEEWTEPDQLAAGAQVLLDTILRLDESLSTEAVNGSTDI